MSKDMTAKKNADKKAAPMTQQKSAQAKSMRPARKTELILLIISFVLFTISNTLVSYKTVGTILPEAIIITLLLIIAGLGLHLLLYYKESRADQMILPIVLTLNGIGVSGIYQIELAQSGTSSQHEALMQTFWGFIGVGLAALFIYFVNDYKMLRRYRYVFMFSAIVLFFLPLVPVIGLTVNGSQLWVSFGPFSFQPSEFAKIFIIIFFAGYLLENQNKLSIAGRKILGMQFPRIREFGPIFVIWLISMLVLIFERDLGTGLLLFAIFLVMLYVATNRISWVIVGLLMFSIGAFFAIQMFPHAMSRFEIWLDPFSSELYNKPVGGSGQLVQGLFGLAAGGLFGTGWGQGYPGLTPYASSDFIYSSLGEILGLTGIFAILALFLLLFERGLKASLLLEDGFGKLLTIGLVFSIAFQAFIVIGGVTRVIPLTGLVLPFMAKGGSSLLANWIIIGILLSVTSKVPRSQIDPKYKKNIIQ